MLSAVADRFSPVCVVQSGIEALCAMKNDSEALGTFLQLGHYLFRAVELIKATAPITNLMTKVANAIALLDLFQIISDINYFVSGEFIDDFKKSRFCAIAASAIFPIATVGTLVLWLYDISIIKSSLSLIPIIGHIALAAGLVAHTFRAFHAMQMICEAKTTVELTTAVLELSSRILKVALHILLFVPGASVPAVIVLGAVACGLDLAQYFVNYYYPEPSTKAA